MTTISGTLSTDGVSATLHLGPDIEQVSYSVTGTIDTGVVQVERALTPDGTAWEVIAKGASAFSGVYQSRANDQLRVRAFGTTSPSADYSLSDGDAILDTLRNSRGEVVAVQTQAGWAFTGTFSVSGAVALASTLAVTGALTVVGASSVAALTSTALTSPTLASAAGVVGTGTTAGTAGADETISSGAGGAKTDTGHAAGGAAGKVKRIGGVGGATASSGTDAGGVGANIEDTAGNGGAASAGTGAGGAGGSLIRTAGTGGTSAGGLAGKDGALIDRSFTLTKRSVTAMTTTATITVGALKGGLITASQGAAGAATYTMPTGTVLEAAMPADIATGDSFLFSVDNISTNVAEVVTLAGDTDMTLVGDGVVAAKSAASLVSHGLFCVIRTGAHAYSFHRVA